MTPTPEDHQSDPGPSDPTLPGATPSDPTPSGPTPPGPVPPRAGAAPPPPTRRSMLAMLLGLTVVAATLAVFWAAGGFRLAGSDGASDPGLAGNDGASDFGLPVVTMPEDSIFKGTEFVPERPAPDFTLTSQAGRPFRMQESRGKVALLFFGFTTCPDVCPTTLGKIKGALQALGPDADRVQVVFVSVDPERDTPEVMARYLANFDPRIVGVTGDLDAIEAVADGYDVRFYKEYPADVATGAGQVPATGTEALHKHADPVTAAAEASAAAETPGPGGASAGTPEAADYTMAHSSRVFLVDPFGQLRSSFTEPYTPDDIAHDIRVLLDEADA